MSKKRPTPEPIPQYVVCSECGLSWDDHEVATLEECVRLLKAELVKRPVTTTWTGVIGMPGQSSYTTIN